MHTDLGSDGGGCGWEGSGCRVGRREGPGLKHEEILVSRLRKRKRTCRRAVGAVEGKP